jgi:hypothetical protein
MEDGPTAEPEVTGWSLKVVMEYCNQVGGRVGGWVGGWVKASGQEEGGGGGGCVAPGAVACCALRFGGWRMTWAMCAALHARHAVHSAVKLRRDVCAMCAVLPPPGLPAGGARPAAAVPRGVVTPGARGGAVDRPRHR